MRIRYLVKEGEIIYMKKVRVSEVVKCSLIITFILLCDTLLDCVWPKIEEQVFKWFGEASTVTYSAQVLSTASVQKEGDWFDGVVIETSMGEETIVVPEDFEAGKNDYVVVTSTLYSIGSEFIADTVYSDTQHYYAVTENGMYYAGGKQRSSPINR